MSRNPGNVVPNNNVTRSRTRSGDFLLFARNFFRHPRMLGSIIPSSRFLIKQLLEPIDWEKARVIVEYGPGVGGITAEILRRMRPDARLVAIEMNGDFVNFLRKSLVDQRFDVVEASAADVNEILNKLGLPKADYILSGIPLGSMPAVVRGPILQNTREALAAGGSFLVFQFTTRVLPDLNRVFRYVQRKFEPLNILPAHLFFCSAEPA